MAATPDAAEVEALRRASRLELGESEAILVAEALGNVPILMDERRGVQCARSRGMLVIRTPLIYADAKILGLVSSVHQKLDELRTQGFRLSDRHYEQILRDVGELYCNVRMLTPTADNRLRCPEFWIRSGSY